MSDKEVDYEAEKEKRNRVIRAALAYAAAYNSSIGEANRFGISPTIENIHKQNIVIYTLQNLYSFILDYAEALGITPADITDEVTKFTKEDSDVLAKRVNKDIQNVITKFLDAVPPPKNNLPSEDLNETPSAQSIDDILHDIKTRNRRGPTN